MLRVCVWPTLVCFPLGSGGNTHPCRPSQLGTIQEGLRGPTWGWTYAYVCVWQGFQWGTREGPLCDEPIRNVKVPTPRPDHHHHP